MPGKGKKNPRKLADKIAALELRRKVRDLMLQGVTSRREMANALGVSVASIQKCIEFVQDEWIRVDKSETQVRVIKRIEQIYKQSIIPLQKAWQASCNAAEEITTDYHQVDCPDENCVAGFVKGTEKWCERCDGTGKVTVEHVVRKVTGQAGNPAIQAQLLKAHELCAKLEGTINERQRQEDSVNARMTNVLVVSNLADPAQLSSDDLIIARRVFGQLLGGQQAITVEARPSDGPS